MKSWFQIGFLSFLLLLGCKTSKSTQGGETNKKPVVLGLERTGCKGTCPIYKMTILEDGTVNYNGKMFVKNVGNFTKKIKLSDLRELKKQAEEAGFFKLEDRYEDKGIADLPSFLITYSNGKQTKTILCHRNYPESLGKLAAAIEKVVGEDGFTKLK
ncbi:MAG: DUF6438 domain-containing protein [Bacteroidia bacterium]|nr:DUF6438 domain-containing protein [Bacteroidia bacterium]